MDVALALKIVLAAGLYIGLPRDSGVAASDIDDSSATPR
jgi:hypothetical protein